MLSVYLSQVLDYPSVMNSVEREEDDILYKLHTEALKRGKSVVSLRAFKVVGFSSQYGSSDSISYTAGNIVGPPTLYPLVGDNAYSFQMRTYGEWWDSLPSARKINTYLPHGTSVQSQDFIDFLVEKRVTPLFLRVYEIFNPGAIVKVMSFCYDNERWYTLWKGDPQDLPPDKSNCFSVEFKDVSFSSDLYRIEFYHKHLNYYCEIDGVILYGEEPLPQLFLKQSLLAAHSKLLKCQVKSDSNESDQTETDSKELPPISSNCPKDSYFDALPSEIIYLIIRYLDLRSLCVLSRVSKLFQKLCSDPVLYRELDLKPYWQLIDSKALVSMEPKLTALRKLSLAWSGRQNSVSPSAFIRLLEVSCSNITSLDVECCSFVNDDCLKAIASFCPYLKDLSLRHCQGEDLTQTGFKYIAEMKNVTYLNLHRTLLQKSSLALIIKSLQLEHLLLGSCAAISDYQEIAKLIGKHLGKSLKTLDLWRSQTFGCPEMQQIAQNCFNLVEIDLGWCYQIDASCGCIRQLVQNCPNLKKIFLAAIRTVSNTDLNAIATYCRNVEQLDLLGTTDISVDALKNLLNKCTKLKLLDVCYCDSTVQAALTTLKENFPGVQIKCASANFVY